MSGLIAAGRLNRRIVLQTATITQAEPSGEELIDWDAVAEVTLPAEWFPGGTREAYLAQQRLQATIEGVFRIRYRERPDPEVNRIVWDGRTYDLKPAVEVGFHEGWDIPVVAHGEAPSA